MAQDARRHGSEHREVLLATPSSHAFRAQDRRVLLNNDSANSFTATCPPSASTAEEVVRGIQAFVDEVAAARISAMATCVWQGYHTLYPSGLAGNMDIIREEPAKSEARLPSFQNGTLADRFRPLIEAGSGDLQKGELEWLEQSFYTR